MYYYNYSYYLDFIMGSLGHMYNLQQTRKPLYNKAPVLYKQPLRSTMRSVNRNR